MNRKQLLRLLISLKMFKAGNFSAFYWLLSRGQKLPTDWGYWIIREISTYPIELPDLLFDMDHPGVWALRTVLPASHISGGDYIQRPFIYPSDGIQA